MHIQSFSLKDLYSSSQQIRYGRILTKFQEVYGCQPDFIVRAPGRVNLIGQHIDYEGYGVLPFAIEKDCVIAAKKTDSQEIQIAHVDNLYPKSVMTNNPFGEVKYEHPYLQYFFAGYMAGIKEIKEEAVMGEQLAAKIKNKKYQGLKILVEGNVPIASGLSSSSSFCVCSALLSVYANSLTDFTRQEDLIGHIIKYERMVGTACGGMDQSISVLGIKQACLYIQFKPIRSEKVQLPAGYKFVIMNSLEQSKKLDTIGTRYNKRVCECKIAVKLLCHRLNIPKERCHDWSILKQVQDYLKLSLDLMSCLVDQFIERKSYTKQDLEKQLGCALEEILGDILASEIVIECNKQYRIYEAAKHVYTEASRVLKFIEICNSQLSTISKGTQFVNAAILLGRLMNDSQRSCRQLYDCSSELIDQVTQIAREEGALGSRLTGAGWGGCTVSLVPQSIVEQFIAKMKQRFYGKAKFAAKITEMGIDNIIFETIPAPGASLVSL